MPQTKHRGISNFHGTDETLKHKKMKVRELATGDEWECRWISEIKSIKKIFEKLL